MKVDEAKLREYHEALADILCWADGYAAALSFQSDPFARLNMQALRELKSDLYGRLYGKSPSWINTPELPL